MMKNYIKFATACLLAMTVASCADKYEYTPGEAQDVIVSIDAAQKRNIEADGNAIPVVLTRGDASSALNVNLGINDPSGIFTLAEKTASFAAGEKTASVNLEYDYNKLVKDKPYNVEISIADESLTSNYGINVMPLEIKKAWKKLGTVQFYEDWFFGAVFEKELIQSPDGSKTYRLLKPFTKEDILAEEYGFNEEIPYIEFSIDDNNAVHYGKWFKLGFTYDNLACAFASPLYLKKDNEAEAQNVLLEDGVVQFRWFPMLNFDEKKGSYSAWGSYSWAFISMPGGPDLFEYLELEEE